MSTPECPLCHGATAITGKGMVPYCPYCGWKRSAAIANFRMNLKMTVLAALILAGFLFFVFGRGLLHSTLGWIAISCGLPVLILLLSYFAIERDLAKLQALPVPMMPPDGHTADSAGTRDPNAPAFEPTTLDQAILRTSRPRETRMTRRGKLSVAGALLMYCTVRANRRRASLRNRGADRGAQLVYGCGSVVNWSTAQQQK